MSKMVDLVDVLERSVGTEVATSAKRRGRGPARRRKASPAYQYYPKDEAADERVTLLDNEAYGLYRRLFDHGWLCDGLPAEPDVIATLNAARWCGTREKFNQLWMRIEPLFPVDPNDGRRRNDTIEAQKRKQRKTSKERKLAAKSRWDKQHQKERQQAAKTVDAIAYANALQLECLALPFALADLDQDQQQKISAPETPSRAALPPSGAVDDARFAKAKRIRKQLTGRLGIWNVRQNILAAVHQTIALGAPYVDADGRPVFDVLFDEIARIVRHELKADWAHSRELVSIIDAALGRRAQQDEEDRLSASFDARELAPLDGCRPNEGTRALRRRRRA